MPPVGFEPTIPASERTQIQALDRAATGNGVFNALQLSGYFMCHQVQRSEMLSSANKTYLCMLYTVYLIRHSYYIPIHEYTGVYNGVQVRLLHGAK